jgi:hypothetical protein
MGKNSFARTEGAIVQKKVSTVRKRGPRRLPPLNERAYYTRKEIIVTHGVSAKRLKYLMENGLPYISNGKQFIFPKALTDKYFEDAALKKLRIPSTRILDKTQRGGSQCCGAAEGDLQK